MKFYVAIFTLVCSLFAATAIARDERLRFTIKEAVEAGINTGKIDKDVKLYFGKQAYPKNAKLLQTVTANKKTNFFNKSDQAGCEIAFTSAVISLQERAKKEGGNAVVNIRSVYRNGNLISETEYECGAGNVTGGVALQGRIAKL